MTVGATTWLSGRRDATAIVEGGRSWRYGEVSDAVDALAARIAETGGETGEAVSIHGTRGHLFPIALLAAWRAGRAPILLDASQPASRLAAAEDALRPRARVTVDPDGSGRVRTTGYTGPPARDGAVSHYLSTSGTTGAPAVVAVGHDAIIRRLDWYASLVHPTAGDRTALVSGLGHDPVLRDILLPLRAGGTLVVPTRAELSPDGLCTLIGSRDVTVLHATPHLIEFMLTSGHADRLAVLRLVVVCGAALRYGLLRRLWAHTTARVVSAYGATETPQIASCRVLDPANAGPPALGGPADDEIVDVGRTAGDSELLLADPSDPQVRGLDRGEIVVRGTDLAAGYVAGTGPSWRFTADPAGGTRYREYRTGDIGVRDGNGNVRVVARGDRQLNVNSYRVEPTEVEAAARLSGRVRDAYVGVVRTRAGDLLAMDVVPADPALAAADVRRHLRAVLPGYAVPSLIRIVDGIARDANHKPRLADHPAGPVVTR